MFTVFILFLALIAVGATLLLDSIPGNDRLGWGCLVVGILGALAAGYALWGVRLVALMGGAA